MADPQNNNNDDWSSWRLLVLRDLERLDEGIKGFDPKIQALVEQINLSFDTKFDKLEKKLETDISKRIRDLELAMITLKVKTSLVVSIGLSLVNMFTG
jgi:hypothetical protein